MTLPIKLVFPDDESLEVEIALGASLTWAALGQFVLAVAKGPIAPKASGSNKATLAVFEGGAEPAPKLVGSASTIGDVDPVDHGVITRRQAGRWGVYSDKSGKKHRRSESSPTIRT